MCALCAQVCYSLSFLAEGYESHTLEATGPLSPFFQNIAQASARPAAGVKGRGGGAAPVAPWSAGGWRAARTGTDTRMLSAPRRC